MLRAAPGPRLPAPIETAPDLVIEVLSLGNKEFDLIRKSDDYGRFGVAEYWTVDSADARVCCFTSHNPRLEEQPVSGNTLRSTSLPGVVLELMPLRELLTRG